MNMLTVLKIRPQYIRLGLVAKIPKIQKFNKNEIEVKVLDLGKWLKERGYKGVDVNLGNPPQELSTTYSFSCIGWINLYKAYKEREYLKEAEFCLEKILSMQGSDHCWTFPYEFSNNPGNYLYSCENFMTLKSLIYYWNEIEQREDIVETLTGALQSLTEKIGYNQKGCFRYSPNDRILVPNISSMASAVFSAVFLMTGDTEYLGKCKLFAEYCIENQLESGGFNYVEDENFVYIPYHALETWELIEANKVLNNEKIEFSVRRAINYLSQQLSHNQHRSFDGRGKMLETMLFKTPLWSAKAYLADNNYEEGLKYYIIALSFFKVPNKAYYYFYACKLNLLGHDLLYFSLLDSVFMRYNASAFEIGSHVLRLSNDIS